MISVSIYRSTLVKHEACRNGLALYDAIAALLPEADKRRRRRIRIANWTPLHFIWLVQTGFGMWLAGRNLIPIANLYGANLSGANLERANLERAYRGSSPTVAGWRTSAAGYLEKDK